MSPVPLISASSATVSTTTENVSEMTESPESVDGTTDAPGESTEGEYRTHSYDTHQVSIKTKRLIIDRVCVCVCIIRHSSISSYHTYLFFFLY